MCDCYYHKCEKCDTRISIHISDFCLERDEIIVYCNEHIPEDNVVIFESLGGMIVPIDTPENRKVLEEVKKLQSEPKKLEDWGQELRLIEEQSKLERNLERRLLTPEERHLMLPGYYNSDGFWNMAVKDLEEFPRGYRIGVQFLKEPPYIYGLDSSVTPNLIIDYEVRIVGNPVLKN